LTWDASAGKDGATGRVCHTIRACLSPIAYYRPPITDRLSPTAVRYLLAAEKTAYVA